jgi:hypothetical protein
MESLTRLVTESLARHGFDRPLDYRRLHWSQWFRCESHHSLLAVPSKPGVFAIAEEVVPLRGASEPHGHHERSEGSPDGTPRRLLAVTQFFDADDMAFTLDRMLTRSNPMRARLASGRYFVRYVVIEEESQRRSISAALNQWIANQSPANQSTANAGEKASAIGTHFASSLELTETREGRADEPALPAQPWKSGASAPRPAAKQDGALAPEGSASHLNSGAASNLHCPSPLPSGF